MGIEVQVGRWCGPEVRRKLLPLRHLLNRIRYGGDLAALAVHYHSDKAGRHFYTEHYERHFGPRRRERLTVLEIGVGGNENPRDGGWSLRMWKDYFPRANIVGIDLYDKSCHDEHRVRTFKGDQADESFLQSVVSSIGRPDIVIDDGSHRSEHVIKSFNVLFPLLADTGIYAIEDLQTSYWPEYGGSEADMDSRSTTMGFLKSLVHGLNHAEMRKPDRTQGDYERWITGISFYHNLAFIQKGRNDEPSYSC